MHDSSVLETSLYLILALAGIGLVLGFVIAFVAKKFSGETNHLIEEVDEELPKGQCGACGFAGCRQYAEAVVLRPEVPPNLCTPGGDDVAKMVAKLTGKVADPMSKMKAVLMCGASKDLNNCVMKHMYDGIDDCIAANLIYAGEKACEYGCLGHGNCVKACPYDAITMDDNGLPKIHYEKCVGCGVCVALCPRHILELINDEHAKSVIKCKNKDKGAKTAKICTTGCIACTLCAKACPHGGIKIADSLAQINYDVCRTCHDPLCLTAKCRPHTIRPYKES